MPIILILLFACTNNNFSLRAFLSFFFRFEHRAKFVPDFQPTDEVQSQPVIKSTLTTTKTAEHANTDQEIRQDEQQNILSTSSLSPPPSPEEAEKIILNLLPR